MASKNSEAPRPSKNKGGLQGGPAWRPATPPPLIGSSDTINHMADQPRTNRAYRNLRATVLAEQPTCQLRLGRCTTHATQVDHIVPLVIAPHLLMERNNLQAACANCNLDKSASTHHQPVQPPALDWYAV